MRIPVPAWMEGGAPLPGKSGDELVWIGPISFERRCTGSLQVLAEQGVRLTKVVLLDYLKPNRRSEERDIRDTHRKKLFSLAHRLTGRRPETVPLPLYSYSAFQSAIDALLAGQRNGCVITDISCLTKLHVLALAARQRRALERAEQIVAYTHPVTYGDLDSGGWKDVVIAPMTDTIRMENEAGGRGIVILGRDSARSVLALSEVELSGGKLLLVISDKRLELSLRYREANRDIIGRLTKLHYSDWGLSVLSHDDTGTLERVLEGEVQRVERDRAPLTLLPFGPKWYIFSVASYLAQRYGHSTRFVYPMPVRHSILYSEGIASTWWTKGGGRSASADDLVGDKRSPPARST